MESNYDPEVRQRCTSNANSVEYTQSSLEKRSLPDMRKLTQSSQTVRQLEHQLHVDIVPGTEVMVDVGNLHFVKSSAKADRVLVPQPSSDPHDPLNWSTFWKFSTLTCATFVTFMQTMSPVALAPMFPELIKSFDSNLTDVIQFTGVAILVLGFSNFIWYAILAARTLHSHLDPS